MNRNPASAGRLALTQYEPDRHRLGLQRVQPSAEYDRASGRPGGGCRLSGDRETGGGRAAVAAGDWCGFSAKPACPSHGASRSAGRPAGTVGGTGSRSARGLFQLRRQRQGGLGAPHHGWRRARAADWSTAAWRRSSWPPTPTWTTPCRCWPRAAFIMPGKSACRCSGCLPSGRSPARWPSGWPISAARLKVGDPTLPDTEVGPLIRHQEVRPRGPVGARGGRRAAES